MKKWILVMLVLATLLVSSVAVIAADGRCCQCKKAGVEEYAAYHQPGVVQCSTDTCKTRYGTDYAYYTEINPTCCTGLSTAEARDNCCAVMNAHSNTEVCLGALGDGSNCCQKSSNECVPATGWLSTGYRKCVNTGQWNCDYQKVNNVVKKYSDPSCSEASCFLPGTKITMADFSVKNIEEVQMGDKVLSFNETTGKNVGSEVVNKFIHIFTGNYLVINKQLKVTPEHLMYVNGKWVHAGSVRVGDVLLDIKGDKVVVESIEKKETSTPIKVYNLGVLGSHTFYAENLVHNEDKQTTGACCYVGGCASGLVYQDCNFYLLLTFYISI